MSPGVLTTGVVNDTTLPEQVPESLETSANQPQERLFSLRNRLTVVTGGGRGLGLCLAFAIIEAGGHVACLDVLPEAQQDEWARLQKKASSSHLTASYHCCDITNEPQLQETLEAIEGTAQSCNATFAGMIACAGVQQKMPALDYPMEDFERIMRINVTGTFLTVKHAAKMMVKNKTSGSIVMIASMSGQIANRVCALTKERHRCLTFYRA